MAKYEWRITCNNPEFNGNFWGVNFTHGIACVNKKYYADLLQRKGCQVLEKKVVDKHWAPYKILVIRLGAYGDNLMITTAIHGLRNKFPSSEIHFFGSEPHNQMLINNPDINKIVIAPIQDIGHMIEDYDEVYDLIEHIEHNPDSDWRNAYDLAEERLEVTDWLTEEERKPVFVPTSDELAEAKHILNSYGFDVDKDPLILIHAESSSIIRRLSIGTALEVCGHFIDKGFKILFAGHDAGTPNMEFKKCVSCNQTIVAELIGGIKEITINCPHCKEINTLEKTDKNKNIFFLHQLLGQVPARTIFTMQKFVELVIAVDSAHSHIATALDKPSVLIYGPIDPILRQAKGYGKTRVLFEPIGCGPCHQLSPYCVIHPKGPAPCITQFTAEDIIREAELALTGDYDIRVDECFMGQDLSLARSCPVCEKKDFQLISRKSLYFYIRCNNCDTIYLDRIPEDLDKVYDNKYISYHEHNTDAYYRSFANTLQQVTVAHNIKGRRYLDVGCGEGYLLNNMEKLGWEVTGIERERPTRQREKSIVTSLDYITNKYDLISLIHVIEHVEDPKNFLKSVIEKLDEDGVFFLYGHDAATYSRNNSWLPINTKVVGEHLQVITKDNLCNILKSLGLNILQARTFNKIDLMITANKG